MGGAEGTKLDLDFMDMEKVNHPNRDVLQCKITNCISENRCHVRAGGRASAQDQRVPTAEPDR